MLPVTRIGSGYNHVRQSTLGLQPVADVHVVVEATTTVAGATARP